MIKTTVFKAMYNDMVYESAYGTFSIHKTREGAQKAIDTHKANQLENWKVSQERMKKRCGNDYKKIEFGKFQDWLIDEVVLLD